ncbi:hypothetical protein H4S14_004275 [Agrobacterium vitis]|nr:hypothetical protein [Agrobacterium vitis]MBE1440496.1 hypothetical protein [Agrobacterium vitis]
MARWTCAAFILAATVNTGIMTKAEASDGDRPLIWSVSRAGKNGVAIQTGVQLRTDYAPKFGVDTSLLPAKTGVVDVGTIPITLWGSIRLDGVTIGPGDPLTMKADINPLLGSAGLSLLAERSWGVSPDVDISTTSILRLGRASGEGAGLSANQRLDLTMPDWNTSFYSEAGVDSVDNQTTGSVGLDKNFFKNVNVSASLTDVFTDPAPLFHAGYTHQW